MVLKDSVFIESSHWIRGTYSQGLFLVLYSPPFASMTLLKTYHLTCGYLRTPLSFLSKLGIFKILGVNSWTTWKLSRAGRVNGKWNLTPILSKQAIEVVFSHRKMKPTHPPLKFNGIPVKRETYTQHLGEIFDKRLHIDEKVKMTNNGLGLLLFLSKYLRAWFLIRSTRCMFDHTLIMVTLSITTNTRILCSSLNPSSTRLLLLYPSAGRVQVGLSYTLT